jgi:hypothetical protein
MKWINALAAAAKVVIDFVLRYFTDKVPVRPAMGEGGPAANRELAVPVSVPAAAPNPAAAGNGVNEGPKPVEGTFHGIDSIAQSVLAVAKSQLGVQEHPRGSNSGPEVDRYLAFVHTRPGEPWCAAAVSWCCNGAALPKCGTAPAPCGSWS